MGARAAVVAKASPERFRLPARVAFLLWAFLTRSINLSQSVSPLMRFFRKEYKSFQSLRAFFANMLMCSAQKVTDQTEFVLPRGSE